MQRWVKTGLKVMMWAVVGILGWIVAKFAIAFVDRALKGGWLGE